MPVRTAKAVLDAYWDRKLPVDPTQIARAMGAEVYQDHDMVFCGISGSFEIEGSKPVIRYSSSDANVRQRFTVAHELGHMCLQHGNSFRDTAGNYSSNTNLYKERDANTFAAELLMPREVIEWLIFKERNHDVESMARVLNVSSAAMHYRLKNLGYL